MERLILEIPSIKRKDDAINFIKEFNTYKKEINGASDLENYIDSYEDWLLKLVDDCNYSEKNVPALTFFLVRENDNKIVGITNIRLALNEYLKNSDGHISYSIRPTERGKGYSKINLYLALKECTKHNIKEVLISCYRKNIASSKTIIALGGIFEKEIFEEKNNDYLDFYTIDVENSIEKYKDLDNRKKICKI